VATPAKKIQHQDRLKNVEKNPDASNASGKVVLTPARQDEILDRIAVDWRKTFELLERFDRGEPLPDIASK
jgi:hypothetical protein